MSQTDCELQAWRDSAGHWIRNADRIELMTRTATEALIHSLAPVPGQRLLDVAAGAGDPALRLAQLVGPTGHVTATDGVSDMLETLRARAADHGLRHVAVLETPAEQLDLPAGSYDGACSRFGVMFFADPERALRNMRRAVRAGGRLVLVAWGARDVNPFFTLTMDALDETGTPGPSLPPGNKTVFEFADLGQLATVAGAAGWRDVREERPRFTMRLPSVAPEGVLDALAELSRRVSDRLAGLDAAAVGRARALVTERSRPYARDGDVVFPAEVVVVSGLA